MIGFSSTSSAMSEPSNSKQELDGLDKFGFPIGTHDAQGRKYGQLDDLYNERDKLNASLLNSYQRREALNKEKYDVPLSNGSDTLKQEISTRATLIAINQLITENDEKIKTTEDLITVNNASIERMETQYNTLKASRDSVSKGGHLYKNKTAYAKIALSDEAQKKRQAEVTLVRAPLDHDAQVMLSCANTNIAKWSSIEAELDAERQKLDDLMKIYRV